MSDKSGAADLASGLNDKGVEILSTGGTAKILRASGIPLTEVSDYTSFPEMLDGRVKTLHPKVYGGLLEMRSNPEHVKKMAEYDILPIDIGAGQMSRADSNRLAVLKFQSSTIGAVLASDAMLPFRDGLDEAFKPSATVVIQPGGSLRDNEVIAAADEQNIAMVFTGMRHFRH